MVRFCRSGHNEFAVKAGPPGRREETINLGRFVFREQGDSVTV